jgi:hypothetical protein
MDGVKESLLLSHHTREITGLTQSLDGSRLVSSSLDGLFRFIVIKTRFGCSLGYKERTGSQRIVPPRDPRLFRTIIPYPKKSRGRGRRRSGFSSYYADCPAQKVSWPRSWILSCTTPYIWIRDRKCFEYDE